MSSFWALPCVGCVLLSESGVSMKLRYRPQNVPVNRMFWWHKPQKYPSLRKQRNLIRYKRCFKVERFFQLVK